MKGNFSVNEEFVRDIVELAIKHGKQLKIGYIDQKGQVENRVIEPMPLEKPNNKNFGGHCQLRDGFRNFSYDRVVRIVLTDYDRTVEVDRYASKK